MEANLFDNEQVLAWLRYFMENANLDLARVKILDITRKNKNLLPTVLSNRSVLVFTDAGHPQIFYDLWDAGLGSCEIWYNEGSEPAGPIKHDKLKDMINRGINASAAMLVVNPEARSTYHIGIDNQNFSTGSIHYVGSEIRAVIMNKLHVELQDVILTGSAASIAVEAAMIANEGNIIAVEYGQRDRDTMEENVTKFGLQNVTVLSEVTEQTMQGLPVPRLAFLVASEHVEDEIRCLLKINPEIQFVFYTLNFEWLSRLPQILKDCGRPQLEILQVQVSKLNSKQAFDIQPAPCILATEPQEA